MFERPDIGERAVLVHMDIRDEVHREDLDEFKELVASAGAEIAAIATTSRNRPEAKYFVGVGKAKEIAELVKQHEAELVLFNHALTLAGAQPGKPDAMSSTRSHWPDSGYFCATRTFLRGQVAGRTGPA